MSAELDAHLFVELSRLAAQRAPTSNDASSPAVDQLLASITAFHDLVRLSADLQGQAVRAAHEAGVSWTSIGTLPGTSRQAVQQRFDPNYMARDESTGATRTLGPVSRAKEMRHLAEAGAQGWRLVKSLHGEHVLERDPQKWEVRRVSVLAARPMPSRRSGWHAAATRFPDCFYIRPRQDPDAAAPSFS
ncbi:hypothetical protein FQ377_03050 [Arthrobacter echini]|uniref:Uncharacterized protein n=1 Tax=Arthrobacter echini TaxID=1529066 RepID=A0A5D0XUS9_9MICC|nr:hypothetical protein [Arthrobacter echini]TYD00438.1 hypothetical protein FQ377_03050 [Arthrobacter echini]